MGVTRAGAGVGEMYKRTKLFLRPKKQTNYEVIWSTFEFEGKKYFFTPFEGKKYFFPSFEGNLVFIWLLVFPPSEKDGLVVKKLHFYIV